MKTKKTARKVVASKRVAQGMNMWMVAGVLVVIVGGAYLIKSMAPAPGNINEIGNTVQTGEYLIDTFSSSTINETNWKKVIPEGQESVVTIKQSVTDNLIIGIKGTGAKANAFGALQAKFAIKNDQNYSATVSMYKPILPASNMTATSGIRFVSGADDEEAAIFSWRKAANGKYYLVTKVRNSEGDLVEGSKTKEVTSSSIKLRIDRKAIAGGKDKYTFYYNDGGDESSDWALLSDAESTKLGGDGRVQLFASSPKVNGVYVNITARFDRFSMKRDKGQGTVQIFNDTFGSTTLNPAWTYDNTLANPVVNTNKVLVLPVKVGASVVNNVSRVRESRLVLNQLMEGDKPSTMTVSMLRPVTQGTTGGVVASGFGFDVANNAANPTDSEGARIMWRGDKLIAVLAGVAGSTEALRVESPAIPASVSRISAQIVRRDNRYILRYKLMTAGADERPYTVLIDKTSTTLGNSGKYYLFTNNSGTGTPAKYPAGYGRFDAVTAVFDN